MEVIVPAAMGLVVGAPWVSDLVLAVVNWADTKRYLESGKLQDVVPESKDLVIPGDPAALALGSLTALDGLLVASSATGMVLLTVPGLRWYGAATLLGSFLASRTRDNAKLIAATSAGLTLLVTNPVAAAGAGINLASAAGTATINGLSSAVQLSFTVVGALVTTSGAVVAYLLVPKKKKKKNG
jgi:hypothetical protein